MKIVIVLQILSVLFQYRIVNALYNFGFKSEPEDPKRIRIYLEEDERLLVPKDSKIEYVSPDEDEVILDKPPSPPLIYQGLKKPLPPQFLHNKISTPVGLYQKPAFTLEDLRVKTDLSGFPKVHLDQQEGHFKPQAQFEGQATSYGQLNAIYSQVKDSPIAYGKLLRPILLLPNGWIHGVNLDNNNYNYEKPVTESHPDDLKYDFRTKTHHLR